VAVIIVVLCGQFRLSAQVDDVVWASKADSLAASGVHISDSLMKGFNALNYSMQKRYRPTDEMLFTKFDSIYVFGAGRHGYWFIIADVMTDYISDGNPRSYSWTQGGGVTVGHRFKLYHSWRARLSVGQMYRNSDYRSFLRGGLSVEHNYYLVSYLNGFRRIRAFDLYTIEGLGTDVFFGSAKCGENFSGVGSVTVAPYMKLGFGMQFKFCERVSFSVNPHFLLYPIQMVAKNNGIGNIDARQYNYGFGLNGGIQVDLGDCFDGKRSKEMNEGGRNSMATPMFVSAHGGFQFQNGDAMWDTSKLISSLRENVVVSFGKWMIPSLAVRVSAFHGKNIWKQFSSEVGQGVETDKYCHYNGFRAEVMMDPWGFATDSRKKLRFSIPLIAGFEGGIMRKEEYSFDINRRYVGFSFGVQPRYNVGGRFAIYLEPHLSLVPYSFNDVVNGQILDRSRNYWDGVVSLSLGLEISLGNKSIQ